MKFSLFALSIAVLCTGCSNGKKWPLVIVLGIDGMDPKFVGQHMGELPNVSALIHEGEFKRLQTTLPPQSPVAWSTFSTGLDPKEHGLLDFVYRDPRTGKPFSSMGETVEPAYRLNFGAYTLPLGLPHIKTFRRGTVFWKLLGDAGVPTKVLRMPVNYPPVKAEAIALSGMGVPDMRGTFGTFTFFTDNPFESKRELSGGEIVPVKPGERITLEIQGPANPYLRDKALTKVEMTADVDAFENVARFKVQDRTFILRAGEWSEWVPVAFPHANGMVRVYAKGFRPSFEIYVSPVNFDPLQPDAHISSPASESARIASHIGRFYTQGMAEDTAAFRHGVFSRDEYLTQSRLVSADQIGMLKAELTGFQQGFLFLHFSGVDQNSHMLWGKFDQDLLGTYKLADDLIGWVKSHCPDATLIVMSDHGFSTFERSVNLNAWFLQQGLSQSFYALGLNGVYLNLSGRERGGTVAKASAAQALEALGKKLVDLRDPTNGKQVIARVWSPHPDFRGDIEYLPDLVVGYEPGYRSSWEGDLGSSQGPVLADNNEAWIGDHCIAPEFVPGVLISNRRSRLADPKLKDLTVSILKLFGVQPDAAMDGKVIY